MPQEVTAEAVIDSLLRQITALSLQLAKTEGYVEMLRRNDLEVPLDDLQVIDNTEAAI